MSPSLYFDYTDVQGTKKPMCFENPHVVITARTIEEVIPSLNKVQEFVNAGYYAAGYVSYEAAPAFDQAFQVNEHQKMPLLWFGVFEKPINKEIKNDNMEDFHTTDWVPQTNVKNYNKSISKIKAYIEQGDTYQVNYTIRMYSRFFGNSYSYFQQLAKRQAANYSAYLDIGDYTILSASPELFFHLKNGKITTKPMKGTVERGETSKEEQKNADWLYHSEKNRAENVMIVDLLRNDLGTIAKTGSVKVPELFTIEAYPTVFQMTSTVTAEISPQKDLTDIFKALFPCGSITGAPKISTMKIIKELEPAPREVYCGTIGFITPEQEAVFNVPIRTVLIDNHTNKAQYGVGGGITWDSTEKEEYEEVITKAKVLQVNNENFQLLETIGLVDGELLVLNEHLERLKQSAEYFHYRLDLDLIKSKLLSYERKNPANHWKLRLLLEKDGSIIIEEKEISPFLTSQPVKLSGVPIDKNNLFLYHKTTNRTTYQSISDQHPDVTDVLLWNENREVTEFTIGNVVVELDGNLYTPPVTCGLLPGTYREVLLNDGIITERIIRMEELAICSNIWLINSVRKWVPVHFI
ncbi:aminodeoxychorismate synthase component I [Virgibacillus sp. C22-A2]|uniref:Aminodeoxychorismate synthase component I n=1 Tax=Virgibacillus tibetensis TaxID=3042313 RepID=A0ABU6KI51_9BACI|nr:aminodeoxychorismate synthase component I [Virgibacillus sp. C22-A2]